MEKITIKDIAKKAGVSPAVVSIVLNNKRNTKIFVSEEKRKRILEIAKREKYTPNKYAKALATGRTNTIGIIIQHLEPYTSYLLENLQKYALKKDYELMLYLIEDKIEKEKEIFEKIAYGTTDGLIITHFLSNPEEYLNYAKLYKIKIVTITPPIDDLPCVYFDEKIAGEISAKYLIKTGCKRLCVAGGYKDSERFKGFIEYAKKYNITVNEIIDDKVRGYFEDGFEIAKRILNLKKLPDGIFAFNDTIAGVIISEFNKRGIKIPDEVSIIGCDNTQLCYYTTPNLTSIEIKTKERAKIAIDMIIDIINGKEIKMKQIILKPELVIRNSTRKKEVIL
ncbi:MAG: LacI family transcriptional regulator [Candidatus Omnitrophica bacterium]|nr:LacI family transcriptional regulator [Candidatus Omnitrophota bacterium]